MSSPRVRRLIPRQRQPVTRRNRTGGGAASSLLSGPVHLRERRASGWCATTLTTAAVDALLGMAAVRQDCGDVMSARRLRKVAAAVALGAPSPGRRALRLLAGMPL